MKKLNSKGVSGCQWKKNGLEKRVIEISATKISPV